MPNPAAPHLRPTAIAFGEWPALQTLILAGGGNRCLWQAGLLERWLAHGLPLPAQLIGTSCGGAIGASLLHSGPRHAFESCKALYAANQGLIHRAALRQGKLHFAHREGFPKWVQSFVHTDNFAQMCNAPSKLKIALSRPARWLGRGLSVLAATGAYLIDKHVAKNIHPALPRYLGLRQEFIDLHACANADEAVHLIVAAGSCPPFTPARWVQGDWAMDGGYVDNAPLIAQDADQRAATLILLTRHYPKLPPLFRWQGRNYWQPSRPVPVSTWDCTPKATVDQAYAFGGLDWMRSGPAAP